MSEIWKRRWVRNSLGSIIVLFVLGTAITALEVANTRRAVIRLQGEVNELTAFKSQFDSKTIAESCQSPRYPNYTSCFRERSKPYLKTIDATQMILLLSIGVGVALEDKKEKHCTTEVGCVADLYELNLDFLEIGLNSVQRNVYSPWFYDQIDRLLGIQSIQTMKKMLEKGFNDEKLSRSLASANATDGQRIAALRARFNELKERIPDSQSSEWLLSILGK